MPSIESLGHPLVFRVSDRGYTPGAPQHAEDEIGIRLEVRALEGMQKEALVHYGPNNSVWRMVSDEGPYLNGTDLAPFPLAFYTAGMAFSFLAELERHAASNGVAIQAVSVVQDNYYTMEGSAIRGDMIGGAKPVELAVDIETDASPEAVARILELAEATSPAQAYMNDVLQNTFALQHNGRPLSVEGVSPSPAGLHRDPEPHFDAAQPQETGQLTDIITKLKAAEAVFGVEGGAGSSLKSEQKRTLHVRGIATRRDDGLREVVVQLFKPIGSTFRFISDEKGEQAPPALAYLSAGVGFCYMTQLGRYAHIVKQDLESYRIVQENLFKIADKAQARPVDTHLFVTLNDSEEGARRLLTMGERTCFLHAAMRGSNRSRLTARHNGQPIAVPDRTEA